MTPQPDPKATREFLERFEPQGTWCLTAFNLEQTQAPTKTFTREQGGDVTRWLAGLSGFNQYFSVNLVRGILTKRADREDIAELHWLHVDLDPRVGEPLDEEQDRMRRMVDGGNLKGLPKPTFSIFSGSGFQLFWRLAVPVIVNNLEHAEELAQYNRQISRLLDGDKACHDISRVMRLPGTLNLPGVKKKKAGRTGPVLAAVHHWDDVAYELKDFTKAAAVQSNTPSMGGGSMEPKISGNMRRLESVDELPDTLSGRCKMIIVQGVDPDDPTRHSSRSEWSWYATCEMVRCSDCTDEQIFNVLTDPGFKISAHVLAQSNPVRYALRQIERARLFAIHPKLLELNDKHAVIRDGKCLVISEVYDYALKRFRLSRQSFEAFRNSYCNKKIECGVDNLGKPIFMVLGKWWLAHGNRREYDTISFSPGKETPGAYNLWQGFACESTPGDCGLFLEHVKDVVCSGNAEHNDYLLRWMANAVQNPGSPGQVAVVLKGKMGVGKGYFAKTFGNLFGRHYFPVSSSQHMVGNFNAHLRDCVVLFGDEAFYAKDKKHEAILKTLITEETLAIEAKGIDVEISPNCIHLIMASNERWAVPAGVHDRRFFILQVSDRHMQDKEHFTKIERQMQAGGREALLHYLMSFDLAGFDVRERPKTEALQEEKESTLDPEMSWWYSKLQEGRILVHEHGWPDTVMLQALHADYLASSKQWGDSNRASSPTRMALFLRKVIPAVGGNPRKKQVWGQHNYIDHNGQTKTADRPYVYLLPDLETCRKHWEASFEVLQPWAVVEDEPQPQALPF